MRSQVILLLSVCASLRAAPVTGLAFSPDGTVLASVSGSTLSLRDPATADAKDALATGMTRLTSVAFAPAGAFLAVGGGTPGEEGMVRLLDWRAKSWLATQECGGDLVTSVTFSPDGRHLAAATMGKLVHVFRVSANEPRLTDVLQLRGHSGPVTAVAFSPDGKVIVTASLDRSLKIWSAMDGTQIRSMGQHTDAVHCVAFRPANPAAPDAPPHCVTGGDDRTVRVWQPTIGRMVRIVRGHGGSVLALACDPDGRSHFSAGQEGIVRQIDADSDAIQREWRASSEWIHSLAISPDGRTLACGDWQGKVTVQEVKPASAR